MEKLSYARSFRDLFAYQQARSLAKDIFEISKRFPREETYSLTDQIRRSSRSVGAQIAEAWAKRRYERSFISKLTDADGEQYETQHWLETAADCGYLNDAELRDLLGRCERIGKLLGGMIDKAELFCGDPRTSLREPSAEYFIEGNLDDEL
ncbi:MAG: four helix bundle protein [Caldilineae bacterium]|nr:four helix bundle protein [Anaerolineae bacterium]MCB0256704.1 four helix bundle protein [Anaerolineae bacterium]MCB9153984.1 four helix bundle protein [Caldilineae bacterium]